MPSFKIYLIFDAVKLLYADLPSYFGIKMKRKSLIRIYKEEINEELLLSADK